jgi:hypothetical protein
MNPVLVDTSLWIEFFSKRPKIPHSSIVALKEVISNGDAVLIEPIRAKLFSGHILPRLEEEVIYALGALHMIDLDWNSRTIFNEIITLANIAKANQLRIPGIIDRMILLAAINSAASVASLDQGLLALARKIKIDIWPSES